MKQEMHILPVQCKRCGGLFDLWYDLQVAKQMDSGGKAADWLAKQSFCWRCRKVLGGTSEGDNENEDELVFDEENSLFLC